ncbi:unnamed protein product [Prunus armeniaca]
MSTKFTVATPGHGNLSHPEKATLSSVAIWNSLDNGRLLLAEPVKATAKKRGSKKAAGSNTIDLSPSKLNNIHHFVRDTWQPGYGQAWTKVWKVYFPYNLTGSHWVAIKIDFVKHTATMYDSYSDFTAISKLVTHLHPISNTLAQVLYNMHFYEGSEVEEVKQKGLQMSSFTPFSVCSIRDVPQQRDGTSCGIMTVKFIELLSAGISLDQVDPLKSKYYRLKLAIEGTRFVEDADVDALLENLAFLLELVGLVIMCSKPLFTFCLSGFVCNLCHIEELIRMGLHPSEIISGYNKARKKTIEILDELGSHISTTKGFLSFLFSQWFFALKYAADAACTVLCV